MLYLKAHISWLNPAIVPALEGPSTLKVTRLLRLCPFPARFEPFITVVSAQDGDEVGLGAGAGGAPDVL